jgi:DNA-binding CsgD family transcriptional regulator
MSKEVLERWLAEGLSLAQMGKLAGLEKSTVSYHLKKHGLRPVNATRNANRGGVRQQVLASLVDEELSLAEMARRLDRSVSTVRYWLGRYGYLPLPGARRRAESRRARARGLKRAELECPRHGRTMFVLEGRGYHRCMLCRQERVSEWRRRVKRKLVEEAGGSCIICGYRDCVAALHFHHLDPSQKRFSLSSEGVTRSFSEAQEEARKCVLLCSNCHAEIEIGFRALPEGFSGKIGEQ